MIQFLADNVDQLDLALDQLAVRERNFDRFALMLVDNVVELTLHRYAQDKAVENKMWSGQGELKNDPKLVAAALAQHFDAKVKLAKAAGLISERLAESVLYLHSFRNAAYHQGLRHDRILHSLARFYFENACLVLEGYTPWIWSWGSQDQISHRAMKYLGKPKIMDSGEAFPAAYRRLREVVVAMPGELVADLAVDMDQTIESVDGQIKFLAEDAPTPCSRQQVIIDCQVWPLLFTDEGKEFCRQNNCPEESVGSMAEWLGANYPLSVKGDPIPSWKARLGSLTSEKDRDAALKKYCDFMRQTADLRSKIDDAAAQLDAHIQQQIDLRRGK